jgi:type IV pilus assembly protein PilQ
VKRTARLLALAVVLASLAASRLTFTQAADSIRLLALSNRSTAGGETIVIETSGPVAYAASQPDPLTVVVDLRGVSTRGAANRVRISPSGTAGLVELEDAQTDLGPVARVRISLIAPVQHRVRSSRATILIELDPPQATDSTAVRYEPAPAPAPAVPVPTAGVVTGPSAPPVARVTVPSATTLAAIEAAQVPEGTAITLRGNGQLLPGFIGEGDAWPPRLVLDFPDVASAVPAVTIVRRGPIDRVRVATSGSNPVATRVVIDLMRPAEYRLVPPDLGERDLTIIVKDNAPAPVVSTPTATRPTTAAFEPNGSLAAPVNVVVLDPVAALDQPPAAAGTSAQMTQSVLATPATPSGLPATVSTPGSVPAGQVPVQATTIPVATSGTPTSTAVANVPALAASPAGDGRPPGAPAAIGIQATQTAPSPAGLPPPTQPTAIGATQERQYTGHAVTLDFQAADLRAVLRTFAEISGLNMVIDPAVQGTVDVRLSDVPWDQALEIILRANKLGYSLDGTVVRIAPLTVLSDEEAQKRKLAEEQALSGELRVLTRTLSYARAADLAQLVTRTALSQRGTVQVDERTNTLIITDLQARLDTATQLLGTLDRPEPQVEIEARVVQTTREFARAIGVQWGVNGRVAPELGNTTGLSFPNRGSLSGRTGATQGGPGADPRATDFEAVSTAVNLPAASASTAIGIMLGAVNGAFNLDVALTALERSGNGRVLSTPRVATQNNVEAEVTQGIQIPIQTVANNTVTVTFKDAALTLRVTPQITSANTVIMRIVLENASPDFSRQVNGIPPIDTQRANTQVQVDNGATTVIGGIFVSREQSLQERTPFLHRIPLLGWLFKRDSITDENRELLIFITPRIIPS